MSSQPEIAFDLVGTAGPTLVCLHGLACERGQFSDLIRHLDGAYRILNIDLPGHGQSRGVPAKSIAGLAHAIVPLVMEHAEGPVTLVGHSMGASVCLELARLLGGRCRQVIALDALIAAALYPRRGPVVSFLMRAALACAYRPVMIKMLSALFAPDTSPEVRSAIVATALATPSGVSARLLASLARWDRDRALAATDAPVTIISASANRFVTEAETARLLLRCRIVRFPLGDHFFLVEFPQETARAIDKAIRGRG